MRDRSYAGPITGASARAAMSASVKNKGREDMNSTKKQARVAGILYLMLGPFAPFAFVYVPRTLIVRGDAAATASKIMASESLFRLGIVSSLLASIIMIFVVVALYQLLKLVNKNMAALMVVFVLIAVPIAMLNELNQLGVLLLLHGADSLKIFTADQLHALVMLFLDLHKRGSLIAHIFWGLWLFPLGYLVFKSGFLPRILGVLLIIGCFGYVIQSFASFLLSNFKMNIIFFTSWGELLLPLWLLIKGVNVEQWEKRAAESA
jgi:hypothetical protein